MGPAIAVIYAELRTQTLMYLFLKRWGLRSTQLQAVSILVPSLSLRHPHPLLHPLFQGTRAYPNFLFFPSILSKSQYHDKTQQPRLQQQQWQNGRDKLSKKGFEGREKPTKPARKRRSSVRGKVVVPHRVASSIGHWAMELASLLECASFMKLSCHYNKPANSEKSVYIQCSKGLKSQSNITEGSTKKSLPTLFVNSPLIR